MSETATEGTTETSTEAATQSNSDETTEALGDAGKKALDAMKAKWKSAEAKAKTNEEAAKRLEQIEAANATDLEKAVKAARDEATTGERARTAGILAAAEARAQAADKFRNPATAVKLLDLSEVKVADDGSVDADAVKALLDGLAESDPYLLKDDKPEIPTPGQAGIGVTGGAVSSDPRAADLAQIEADVRSGARRKR